MADSQHDVVIVGAGPAGLGAAAHARASGLDYALLERAEHLADTIWCYQKRKHVMAEPGQIPQRGDLPFAAGSRESILDGWDGHVRDAGIRVQLQREMIGIQRQGGQFHVQTPAGVYRAPKVVLAIGTQGNPRQLGVPGQDLPHVSPRLVDPGAYRDRSLVVVGAGDSALEIALALATENHVFLVVRKPEIARAKESLTREAIKQQAAGQLEILYSTNVSEVVPGGIRLKGPQADLELDADEIFVKIGTLPPRGLLESFGISFASADREATPELAGVYETAVAGLHVVGATTGRDLIKLAINQGYEVIEHLLGNEVVPADEEILLERLPYFYGSARQRILQAMDEVPLLGAAAGKPGDGFERRRAAAAEQLRETMLAITPRGYSDGEVIVRQNDYTDSVLAVVSGAAEIRRRDDRGDERKVAVLAAGNFFGEMGLISGRRRNATAIAVGDTRILEIPRKAMLRLVYSAPEVERMIGSAFMVRAFQNYLFPQLPVNELWRLVAQAELVEVERQQTLFREGEAGEHVYILRSGQVKLSKTSGDRVVVICYLVAGNVFGEASLLTGEPRSVTATTIFPSELIRLSRDAFSRFVARFPGLEAQLRSKLEAERLATLKEEATPGAGRVLGELIREEVVMGTDALIIDDYKCIRCNNCIRACEDVHADGQARLSLTGITFANILAPNSCWQCENPLCMLDCPPDALYRDANGEVQIRDNCIGCGNCEDNCPYGNIFMVHPEPAFSLTDWLRSIFRAGQQPAASDRTVAVKCDLCGSIPGGPACVRSCPTGAAIRVKPDEYQRTIEELMVATRE